MDHYDPTKTINGKEWLEIDETDRIQMIEDYHESLNLDWTDTSITLHCAMHVAVENQLAGDEVPKAKQALARLIRQGLGRHDAIHAISAVLAKELHTAMRNQEKELPLKNYSRKLDRITAKRWNKGQY